MSRRADQLAAMRHVADTAKALLGGSVDMEALRQAVTVWDTFRPLPFNRRVSASVMNGGRGGCVDYGPSLPQTLDNGQILKSKAGKPVDSAKVSAKANGRHTWLSRFAAAWVAKFGQGSTPAWGQLGRALKPIVAAHGEEKALSHWKNYLVGAEARFASPQRFAVTFAAWDTPDPDAWRHDRTAFRPGESQDAYVARQTRGGR